MSDRKDYKKGKGKRLSHVFITGMIVIVVVAVLLLVIGRFSHTLTQSKSDQSESAKTLEALNQVFDTEEVNTDSETEADTVSVIIQEAEESEESIESVGETTEWSESQAESSTVTEWLDDRSFRISCHRGATVYAPEDTLEAVHEAIIHGYSAIELDPRLSLDGTIYLMHDDTVARTTNGTARIENMTDQQINELIIDSSGYSKYKDLQLHVPHFADAVSVLENSDLVLNVDCSKGGWLNADYLDEVVRILRTYHMYERCFFVVSDTEARTFINERYPDLCLSWLYDPNESISVTIEHAQTYDRAMISIKNDYATDDRLEALLDSGLYFQVYNVDSKSRMEELRVRGVPMIETNDLIPE